MLAHDEGGTPVALEQSDARRGKKYSSVRAPRYTLLFIPLAGALLAWAAYLASVTYDFTNPQARATGERDLSYSADVFTKIPTGARLVCFLLLFLVCAIGPGDFLLKLIRIDWRDGAERTLFACATGLIIFTFVTLAVGTVGFLQRPICFGLLGLAGLSTLWYGWGYFRARRWRPGNHRDAVRGIWLSGRGHFNKETLLRALLALTLLFYLYIALLGALGPEVQYDGRWYHLGQVRAYVEHERFYNFIRETRLGASAFDPYQIVLYTALWDMVGMIGAKLLHWSDALLTACTLIYFCRTHFRSLVMGLVSAIILISTPLITWSSSTGGNDLQLALYALLSIHAFLRWRERPDSMPWLIVLGMLSGYAIGSKSLGVLGAAILMVGVCIVLYQSYRSEGRLFLVARRAVKYIAVVTTAMLVACLPWFIRSAAETGNPIFPLLNGVFHSPYWTSTTDTHVAQFYASFVTDRWSPTTWLLLPRDAIALVPDKNYRAVLGPLFTLMLPIWFGMFLLRRRTDAHNLFRLLVIYVIAWMSLWYIGGTIDLRLATAVMPIMAMLVAFPLVNLEYWSGWPRRVFLGLLWTIAVVITLLNAQPLVSFQRIVSRPTAYGRAYIPWAYLYGGPPDGGLLSQNQPVIQYMNRHLSPPLDKVYDAVGIITFAAYSDIQIFNGNGYDGPTGMRQWDILSADALNHLQQEHITYVYLSNQQIPSVKKQAIWDHLQMVYSSTDHSGVLFRVR